MGYNAPKQLKLIEVLIKTEHKLFGTSLGLKHVLNGMINIGTISVFKIRTIKF